MGQQLSKSGPVINRSHSVSQWSGKITPKTHFHYIHPIQCQIQQHPPLLEQPLQQEIDLKTHQVEYWEIENNQDEPTLASKKDLEKIEQIKVRWNEFIKMKKKNYLQDYTVLKEIGRGGFGCVHKVKARYTGLYRAAKRIKKAQMKKAEHQKLFEEMAIMISLDHPNIAKLYEVYDYKSYYVLILQLCQGGEVFKKIVTKQLTEDSSANIMKQILWTLIYLHKKGIVHRDLKPENMLFELDSDMIKIIDFGIAVKRKGNQVLTARLGTPYYIAPEVLCKSYGEKCDIWSAGVILFMMISGYPPFRGDNQYEVMESVLKETVAFKGVIWTKVSQQCKSLVSWMLKKNPQQRPSAQQAYHHPWIKKVLETKKSSKQQIVISNIRDFSFDNKLQAVVYTYIVSQLLRSDQKKMLFETFKELDKNNDGVIESTELAEALRKSKNISEERVKLLMRVIDTNSSGHIDYTQFLVAGLNPKMTLTEEHFEQAFQYFDMDHSGAITFEQIAHFLQDTKESQQSIKMIFQQVDQNNDGHISKEEFVKLLMHQTKKKLYSMKSLKSFKDLLSPKQSPSNDKRPSKDLFMLQMPHVGDGKKASLVMTKNDAHVDKRISALKQNQAPVFNNDKNEHKAGRNSPQIITRASRQSRQLPPMTPAQEQKNKKTEQSVASPVLIKKKSQNGANKQKKSPKKVKIMA